MANNLSPEDIQAINEFNLKYRAIIETIQRAMQFKLDDYLVLYASNNNGTMVIQKNSYGAPIKYKVVHITAENVAFVKKVNKKGNPIGRIYSCAGVESDNYRYMNQTFRFELDPDFADAILLQDDYDPAHLHRSKKDIWKAVTEHNKACKIDTADNKRLVEFFKNANIGDTIWTSNISYYLIQDKKTLSPADFNKNAKWRDKTSMKGPFIPVLTVRDKRGKVKDISPDFFWHKALYRERPRTYKELNI